MTNEEINGIANGIMTYLINQCERPVDAMAVILCVTLSYYEKAKDPSKPFSIEQFAEAVRLDLIKHWHGRTITDEGKEHQVQ